jgi:hypothetical protein
MSVSIRNPRGLRRKRRVPTILGAFCVFFGSVGMAHADPGQDETKLNPYPSMRFFDPADPALFEIPDVGGVWFLAPTGQTCGIFLGGAFGCIGEIPGAPPGTNHIGWFDGDKHVHYDWTVGIRFPVAQALVPLPPLHFLEYRGTTCGVTADSRTYCERGPLRFVIEPTKTWLN